MKNDDETHGDRAPDDEPRVLKVARVGSARELGQSRREFLQAAVLGTVGGTLAAGTLAGPLAACSNPGCAVQDYTSENSSDCRSEHSLAHMDPFAQVAFASGAGTLFSADPHTVKAWDLAAGTPLRTMPIAATFGVLREIRVSPDAGRMLLQGAGGDGGSVCLVMDGGTGAVLWQEWFGLAPGVIAGTRIERLRHAVLSPDGTLVALGLASPDAVEVRDASSGTLVSTIAAAAPPGLLCFSHDGRSIAGALGDNNAGPRRIDVWEIATGRLVASSDSLGGLTARAMAFTADDTHIVSVSAAFSQTALSWVETKLQRWDAQTGAPGTAIDLASRYPGDLFVLRLGPDGTRLALSQQGSGSTLTSILVLDTATGGLVCTYAGSAGQPSAAAFSPDGAEVVSARGVLHRWSATSGAFLGFLLDPMEHGTQECGDLAPPDVCTCHTVCGCNQVCNCDEVCSCDCESGGVYMY